MFVTAWGAGGGRHTRWWRLLLPRLPCRSLAQPPVPLPRASALACSAPPPAPPVALHMGVRAEHVARGPDDGS